MIKQASLIVLGLFLMAAMAQAQQDWPQFQQNAQRQGRLTEGPGGPYRARWIWSGPDSVLRNKESKAGWKDDITGRNGYSYPMPKSVPMTFAEGMQPVHAGGVLYALDQEGKAYAISMDDGSTKWVGNNPGGSITSPAVAGQCARPAHRSLAASQG